MGKHKFYSLDFIFLYICVFLIGWMSFSYYIESHTDNSYAVTKRVRAGYELRDYKPEAFVGSKIAGEKHIDIWKAAKLTKENLLNEGLEVKPYPFFVRENAEGERFIFFIPTEQKSHLEGFEYVIIPDEVAYLEFTWYPIDQYIERSYAGIVKALIDEGEEYNGSELWVEVRSPWYAIPFMMHNGVFVEIQNDANSI